MCKRAITLKSLTRLFAEPQLAGGTKVLGMGSGWIQSIDARLQDQVQVRSQSSEDHHIYIRSLIESTNADGCVRVNYVDRRTAIESESVAMQWREQGHMGTSFG